MNILKTTLVFFIVTIFLISPVFSFAQEIYEDYRGEWRSKVVDVLEDGERLIPGTDILGVFQIIEAEILEGDRKGEKVILENDFLKLKKGDKFFLNYLITMDDQEILSVGEVDRRGTILLFTILFIVAILSFGLFKGIRSLLSLLGSLFIIIYFLIPQLLSGSSPALTIVIFAALILAFAMYITHGWNKVTHAAFLGTSLTIVLVSFLAEIGVKMAKLSGFSSDEAIYLNLSTGGSLDLQGILLGAIIIGVLGILDDISITQSAAVKEIYRAGPNLTKKEVFSSAFNIGREHVMSLVNTLALAYAGASLPLLLLFSESSLSFSMIINREIFSTEIIRTLVGSIGLIMAVPITTILSVFIMVGERDKGGDKKEGEITHAHFHSH